MPGTLTREIAELEELFSKDIPCGGNNAPVKRPCPHYMRAEMVCTHGCYRALPEGWKCVACFVEWFEDHGSEYCRCTICGEDWMLKTQMYRPLT